MVNPRECYQLQGVGWELIVVLRLAAKRYQDGQLRFLRKRLSLYRFEYLRTWHHRARQAALAKERLIVPRMSAM